MAERAVVYRCDPILLGGTPENEVRVGTFDTIDEAMQEANRLRRSDPRHSYVVGVIEDLAEAQRRRVDRVVERRQWAREMERRQFMLGNG